MKVNYTVLGIFVISAVLLFAAGLFIIGDRQEAFNRHRDVYTEMASVNGLSSGTKVRVAGYDAGKVKSIEIPDKPSGKFRVQLQVEEKLHKLIRDDSVVSVESDGVVGDKFLLISAGSDARPEVANNATLICKPPIEISAVLEKATGLIDQANVTIGDARNTIVDVRGRLDGTLDAITATVNNTNGVVTGIRQGKGAVGLLLNDPQTVGQIKQGIAIANQAVASAADATANLRDVSTQAKQEMTDFQSRDLFHKAEDTLNNAKQVSQQLDQTSQNLNATVNSALGPDNSGAVAAENIRESLSNVNLATSNIADDTEALKHNFLFRGYFKRRGFYSLDDLSPEQYRSDKYFRSAGAHRGWLGAEAFQRDANGNELLSQAGRNAIDLIIGAAKDSVVDQPIVVEGYSSQSLAADQMASSRLHTILVADYLEKRFHLKARNVGLMPLNSTPPESSGKPGWDGACIVLLSKRR